MIGLVAPLVAAIVLKEPALALAALPYILRVRGRNISLVAFYAYVLTVIFVVPPSSIYESEGLRVAVLLFTSTFLLLDEILGGIALRRDRILLSGLLIASSVNDYATLTAMVGASLYAARSRFGKGAYYLAAWMAGSALVLYLLRENLSDPVMQAFTVVGLGVAFLLLAERNDVEFAEVSPREED